MSEKPSSTVSSLPGYGFLAVVVALLSGLVPMRKEGDKKPEPPAQAAPAQPPKVDSGAVPRTCVTFLTQKNLVKTGRVPGLHLSLQPDPGVKFLILTLPDPVDSQLGYWYDQSVDALTRAMSHLGGADRAGSYALADQWFPWTIQPEPTPQNTVKRTGTLQTDPGVLVYRRASDSADRIVVFLVGENSITGLRAGALQTALDLAVMAPAPREADEQVRLVGPFFTGSQASLAQALWAWHQDRESRHLRTPRVQCVSGSALGLRPWKELLPCAQCEDLESFCGAIQGTQVPINHLNRAAMRYLAHRSQPAPAKPTVDFPRGKVAYLVEANSGFGEAATRDFRDAQVDPKDPDVKLVDPPLFFRFPMHIGRLSAIQSKQQRERDERLGLIPPGEDQLTALDESRMGGDLIPAADENRTALINRRLFEDFWADIRREGVKYVCVVATDPRDSLFLLEQLQAACPDAQPVVFGTDLHYVYPDYLRFMRGVVVVGAYPLLQSVQRWQMPADDRRRMPFPSGNAEGVYNAVLASLGGADRLADYLPPAFAPHDRHQPPVWVTAVGENGEFIPLAYFTDYDDANYLVQYAPKGGQFPDQPTAPAWPFGRPFFYLTALIVFIAGVGAWRVWRIDRQTQEFVATPQDRIWVPGMRAQYALLTGIGGVFAALPLILAYGSADPAGLGRGALTTGVTLALVVLISAGTFLYLVRQSLQTAAGVKACPGGVPPGAVLAPWQVVAFALLTAGAVFGWLLADHAALPAAARFLFAERSANMFSGCSPVIPACVIAVGLLCYGLLGLEQLRLALGFRVPSPYPAWKKPPAGTPEAVTAAMDRVHATAAEVGVRLSSIAAMFYDANRRFASHHLRPVIWAAVAGLFGLAVWQILSRPARLPLLYWLGLSVALATAALAAVGLAFVWKHEGRAPLGRPRATAWLALLVAAGACAVALIRAQPTWESQAWNCLYVSGFLALAFLTLVAAYRLYLLWKLVEKMMRAITTIPMVGAFDRFPDKLSRVFGAYLLTSRRRSLDLAIPRHLLDELRVALAGDNGKEATGALAVLDRNPIPAPASAGEDLTGQQTAALCRIAAELVEVLAPGWADRPVTEAFGTLPPEPGKEPPQPTRGRELAEQFIAVMVVVFLSQYLIRMRYLAYSAMATSGSLLLAITAYQFEPERFLMYTAVGFAGAVIALNLWLLYRVNRNELISRVTRSTPNRFQPDAAFLQNAAVFVLPLMAIVVTQLAGRMRDVIEPLLGWLR